MVTIKEDHLLCYCLRKAFPAELLLSDDEEEETASIPPLEDTPGDSLLEDEVEKWKGFC